MSTAGISDAPRMPLSKLDCHHIGVRAKRLSSVGRQHTVFASQTGSRPGAATGTSSAQTMPTLPLPTAVYATPFEPGGGTRQPLAACEALYVHLEQDSLQVLRWERIGQPECIDMCMAPERDFCTQPARLPTPRLRPGATPGARDRLP